MPVLFRPPRPGICYVPIFGFDSMYLVAFHDIAYIFHLLDDFFLVFNPPFQASN